MIEFVSAALVAIAVTLWIGWRYSRLQFFRKLGIPGPKPGLLFGNLWEMYKKNPPQCNREWLQKYGKVMGYYHGLEPILLIAEVEIIKQVLVKNFNSFTDKPMVPLMTSALKVLDIKIDAKAESGDEFEIYNLYKGLTMDVIGSTAFGIESNVQDNPAHHLMRTANAILSRDFKNLLLIIAVRQAYLDSCIFRQTPDSPDCRL